jgi:hypothetical protein
VGQVPKMTILKQQQHNFIVHKIISEHQKAFAQTFSNKRKPAGITVVPEFYLFI